MAVIVGTALFSDVLIYAGSYTFNLIRYVFFCNNDKCTVDELDESLIVTESTLNEEDLGPRDQCSCIECRNVNG
jgi:hypothetical protein